MPLQHYSQMLKPLIFCQLCVYHDECCQTRYQHVCCVCAPTDRQAVAKITGEGVFLEALERNPGKFLPDVTEEKLGADVVKVRQGLCIKQLLLQLERLLSIPNISP